MEQSDIPPSFANIKHVDIDNIVVFVSGPLTNGGTLEKPRILENIREAIRVAEHLLSEGFYPLIPHTSWYWEEQHSHTQEEWLEYCVALMRRCDVVYRMDGVSSGADFEVNTCQDDDIPVFTTISQLLEWRNLQRRP